MSRARVLLAAMCTTCLLLWVLFLLPADLLFDEAGLQLGESCSEENAGACETLDLEVHDNPLPLHERLAAHEVPPALQHTRHTFAPQKRRPRPLQACKAAGVVHATLLIEFLTAMVMTRVPLAVHTKPGGKIACLCLPQPLAMEGDTILHHHKSVLTCTQCPVACMDQLHVSVAACFCSLGQRPGLYVAGVIL